jgi:hypothetical protein
VVLVYISTPEVVTLKIQRWSTVFARFQHSSDMLYHQTHPCVPFFLLRLQTTIKKHVLKAALVRAIQTGDLVQVKSSYKPKRSSSPKSPRLSQPRKRLLRRRRYVATHVRVGVDGLSLFLTTPWSVAFCTDGAQTTAVKKVRFE